MSKFGPVAMESAHLEEIRGAYARHKELLNSIPTLLTEYLQSKSNWDNSTAPNTLKQVTNTKKFIVESTKELQEYE